MLRLYFDEDSMHAPVLRGLRLRGFDVETAFDAGLLGRSDLVHLRHASTAGRVLCTSNVGDFLRLHSDWLRRGDSHGGLILIAQGRFGVGEQVQRLAGIATRYSADSMRNQVIFLSNWSADSP